MFLDRRVRLAIEAVEAATENPSLRMAWSLKVYQEIMRGLEKKRGDEAFLAIMLEIKTVLTRIVSEPKAPPKRKRRPFKPGRGCHRERLDALRAEVGLPVQARKLPYPHKIGPHFERVIAPPRNRIRARLDQLRSKADLPTAKGGGS